MPLPRLREDDFPHLLAEVRSSLWNYPPDSPEANLEAGKVHNLRVAARLLDGAQIEPGETFSFWRHIGKCSRSRGFVAGRQLQEGCLVPAVGGGLCQLSNALYQAALRAGLEVVERHAHSRPVPGSAAEFGADATVAWNYVDLRFRFTQPFRISVRLTSSELVVAISSPTPKASGRTLLKQAVAGRVAQSCASCGEDDCYRHRSGAGASTSGQVWIVDAVSPEWKAFAEAQGSGQTLLSPLDGLKWKKPAYAWPEDRFAIVDHATAATMLASYRTRQLAGQGAARQVALLDRSRRIATALAKRIPFDARELVVAVEFLPFLWELGLLGGRRFTVLTNRLPMSELQRRLDEAAARHPESTTLADYRADSELVRAEAQAFEAADRIVTAHSEVASWFADRAERLPWFKPEPKSWVSGARLAFAGPTVGRKGAYEVREAARELGLELVVLGRNLEDPSFWDGLNVSQAERSREWWNGCFAVVQPAIVEENPRGLLAAQASGVPVLATSACGLDLEEPVQALDAKGLTDRIRQLMETRIPSVR